jgi:hypothetical protein
VAIKIIQQVKTEQNKVELERERSILLRLKHPHIVKLHKVVDDPGRKERYMVGLSIFFLILDFRVCLWWGAF